LARLSALMLDYAVIMTTDYAKCVIRVGDKELSPSSRQKLRSLQREIDQTVRRFIERGIADRSIISSDVRLMAFTLTGALNWIARWYEPMGAQTPEQIAQHCVGLLISGIAPRAEKPRAPEGREQPRSAKKNIRPGNAHS
jgi:hypothetical protein